LNSAPDTLKNFEMNPATNFINIHPITFSLKTILPKVTKEISLWYFTINGEDFETIIKSSHN